MTRQQNNALEEGNLPRSHRLISLGAVLLIIFMTGGIFFTLAHPSKGKADNPSFSFTAAGDYGQTKNTTATLKNIGALAKSGAVSFNLAIGDLNYDYPTVSAQQWSQYVTGYVGQNFPFEIVAGEHDTGDITQLETDLPDHIGNIIGTYGEEYYSDYPPSAPLARFIMASPGVLSGYNYNKGQADYNWVSNTIDDARNNHIPWVIVGIHKYCLAINAATCTAPDLMNLLVSKKVDLILQGQKHGYQASKQLALNAQTCPKLSTKPGTYNGNCVVNSTNSLTKGAGSVILITGTGGKSLSTLDTTDPETGYFRTWMGGNFNPTWGVSQFTVTANQLSMQFDGAAGGTFTDSFTITSSSFTPTPSPSPTSSVTPSPSPSPSVTPSSTPGTTIAQDDFVRANQSLWGTASDGVNTWGADANNLSNFSINNNMGQVTGSGSSATSYNAVLGPSATNAEVVVSGSVSSFGGNTLGAVLRWTDHNNFYKAYINGSNLIILKKVSGSVTQLKSVSFTATAGTSYTIDFSVVGTTLSASVWKTGNTPPSSWMVTTTDTSFSSAGFCGVLVYLANGVSADFTSFLAMSY